MPKLSHSAAKNGPRHADKNTFLRHWSWLQARLLANPITFRFGSLNRAVTSGDSSPFDFTIRPPFAVTKVGGAFRVTGRKHNVAEVAVAIDPRYRGRIMQCGRRNKREYHLALPPLVLEFERLHCLRQHRLDSEPRFDTCGQCVSALVFAVSEVDLRFLRGHRHQPIQ